MILNKISLTKVWGQRALTRLLMAFIAVTMLVAAPTSGAVELCADVFGAQAILAQRGQQLPDRADSAKALAAFAAKNNLPSRWIETGPPERRVKRLYVAIDADNVALVQAYANTFNLTTPTSKNSQGTLVLEFANEYGANYVTAVLRPSADLEDKIYRWGRPNITRNDWYHNWLMSPAYINPTGLLGFTHLIDLNAAERKNVEYYLQHSDVDKQDPIVCAPKSANCVAWTSGIELGESKVGATNEERKFLFSELGIARAMAHFEIGRRLIHAASDRHTAIGVFYKGAAGLALFNDLEKNLPPEPKIPYANIIRGLEIGSPADAAIRLIPDGAKIFMPIAAGASPDAMNALVERAPNLKLGYDVHVLVNGISENAFKKGVETPDGKFRVHALFLGGNLRALNREGKINVVPGNLSDFTRYVRDPEAKDFHYDAMIVRVAPKDANGRYSLGPNNDMIMTILRDRPGIKIIAEVNENVPHTMGLNYLTEDQLTAKFTSKSELAGPAVVPPSDVDTKIGNYLGELVDSGATLQIGIGNIFSALPEGLRRTGKQNISIATEMFGDPLREIMQMGIATKAETGFAYGSSELYKWLNGNRVVNFVETELVNSPGRIAATPKFHAVNTALQVNLAGEVNATMGPDGRISSPGGQVEFMSGAARSEGGKAIIAIRSTAKNGTISSIALDLYRGPITTPHESVTHVVTEFGIAKLKGKSESARAVALISIAHPQFRPGLIHEAIQRRIITQAQSQTIPLH